MSGTNEVGPVKWFNYLRGYGFVTVEGLSEDVFFHKKHLIDEKAAFTTGELIHFQLNKGKKGYFATKVMKAADAPTKSQ